MQLEAEEKARREAAERMRKEREAEELRLKQEQEARIKAQVRRGDPREQSDNIAARRHRVSGL